MDSGAQSSIFNPRSTISSVLAESAADVVFREWVGGVAEEFEGIGEFDEFAEVEEGGVVGDAGGLLHVVGNDDEGVLFLEGPDEVLDFGGGDGVEGAAWFVHEEDAGFDGEASGDAQALLLAAGKTEGGVVQAVFDFIPEGGGAQRGFDGFRDEVAVLAAMELQAEGDIVMNAAGEGIGFLKDHADIAAEFYDIDRRVMDLDAADVDGAMGDAGSGDVIVHAIEAAEQGGFTTTGGSNQGGHPVFRNGEGDGLERTCVAITEVHVVHINGGGL